MNQILTIEGNPSFAHNVHGGLWIGNAPPILSAHERNTNSRALENFDTIILCAMEYQPEAGLFGGQEVVHAPMDDNFEFLTKECAETAVRAAKCAMARISEGGQVLVTCLAGRNRSGLVCALALCFGPEKFSSSDAIQLVRDARGQHALRNPLFVKFLKSIAK
jgi:protein-tyrosine phosphatase